MRPVGRRTRFAIVATTTALLAALGGFGGWAALSTGATVNAAKDRAHDLLELSVL